MMLEFDAKRGLIVVPVRLYGSHGDTILRLALDTGATTTVINWNQLVLIGYDPGSVENRTQITTGSSLEFVPQVNVNRIEALGITQNNFPVLCHTLPPTASVDGVLGLDFFRGRKLVIDFRKGKVTIS